MARAFLNSKIQPGKTVMFIKPTCAYCRRTQEFLSQLPFKQGPMGNINKIQDYLQQLTGARTVPWVFTGKEYISGCTDLVNMHETGELLTD
ncbi:glutaredoxin-1-like [Cervus canadensis]|uniref:glutaredoxin-1-like n=1 Tax=Cervus canadensis TaxID=1574408 RepID=UPI001C9E42E6|nr:glutaredoxin-1-like [Cervus canadensis]